MSDCGVPYATTPHLPTTEVEQDYWRRGLDRVAGLDEAGRGPWAGPVYAAAVILPPCEEQLLTALQGVRDSKTLSLQQRNRLFEAISGVALSVGVGWSDAAEIDQLGIVPATRLAMWRALAGLAVEPQVLILDALRLPASPLPQVAFPKADATCLSVAAASIVAKVSRDDWMIHHAEVQYPGYGFARHKGYGTAAHAAALDRLGVCPLHRRSFRPIAERLGAVHDSDGCRDRATGAR